MWDALVDAAVAVDQVLEAHGARPEQSVGDGTGPAATARTLAAIEVLTGAMRPDPLAGASNIKLAVCSASNVSPIEEQILAATPTSDTRVDLKLSGNQISNFAAFLSARWRLNDWIWGRMDGAQTLVNVVAGQDRLAGITAEQLEALFTARPDLPDAAADQLVATLQSRWPLYKERAEADPVAVARDAITERLQWEILAEELPLLEQLETRPAATTARRRCTTSTR